MTSCCGPPKRCCRVKYDEPTRPDECRCGPSANNGVLFVLLSQMLLFAGLWFSAATIGDCGLVEVDEPLVVREDNATATFLGMVSYRDSTTGQCYYWFDEIATANATNATTNATTAQGGGDAQIVHYLQTVLGRDWYPGMGLCAGAFGLSVLLFLYSTSFYCSTQVRGWRILLGLLVGVLLPALQATGTVLLFQSDWCDREGCSMGRSTWFSIAAALCFVASGVCYGLMENWPGEAALREMDARRTWMVEKDPYHRRPSGRPSRHSTNHRNDLGRPRMITTTTAVTDSELLGETSREIEDGNSSIASDESPVVVHTANHHRRRRSSHHHHQAPPPQPEETPKATSALMGGPECYPDDSETDRYYDEHEKYDAKTNEPDIMDVTTTSNHSVDPEGRLRKASSAVAGHSPSIKLGQASSTLLRTQAAQPSGQFARTSSQFLGNAEE